MSAEFEDTQMIEERISVFESRFTELMARYSEFDKVLGTLNQRIAEHLAGGKEAIQIARDEQDGANRKKGIAGLFEKRNQGRINAKLLGALERDFAILRDIQEIAERNNQLISDTGEAVKRDVSEMMESVVSTIKSFHSGTASSLRIMSDDIELLKQLAAKTHLNSEGNDSADDAE